MSTVSLATHAGITARYLEMIEAGSKTPSVPVLRKLAKVLGVRTSALLGEAPSEDHEGPVNPRLAEVERAPRRFDVASGNRNTTHGNTHVRCGAACTQASLGAGSVDLPE